MNVATAVSFLLAMTLVGMAMLSRASVRWVRQGPAGLRRFTLLLAGGVTLSVALLAAMSVLPGVPMMMRFWFTLSAITAMLVLSLRAGRVLALAERRVNRRLAVLMLFATVVPAVIMAALWVVSAVLGTASGRALAAARAYQAESRRLEDDLTLALARPAEVEARLADLAVSRARRGIALTVWLRRGEWRRAVGNAALPVPALAAWPAGRAAGATLMVVGGASYAAARVAAPGDSALVAVGLIPARGPLGDDISRRIAAQLVYSGAVGQRVDVTPVGLRSIVHTMVQEANHGELSPFSGFANVGGWLWTGQGWVPSTNTLSVSVGMMPALGGMLRNARVSALAYVPVVLIGIMLVIGLRVLWVNWATLRALGGSITRAIAALRDGAAALEAGRLDHRIAVQGDDELWDVAAGFNRMADGLERGRRLELERERLESEMALARRIQARLLPAQPPRVAGADIAGLSEPARAIGGDYYDHIALADGRVALVIADVSGKGVPAALLMSAFRASLMSQLDDTSDPAVVMARVNRFLHRSVDPGKFVTAFLGVLDPASGRFEYCNAGHNPPFVVTRAGEVTTLETGGLLLGMLEASRYELGALELVPGATLALFTDGVTEAQAAGGAMWGEAPLVELLRGHPDEPCEAFARRIVDEVRRFEGEQGPSDDITLLLARRTGR